MNCKDCHNTIWNSLLAPAASAGTEEAALIAEHLAQCAGCNEEFLGVRKTTDLLDAWHAPEPSPYFDQKMSVRMREEQAKAPAGWLERLRERLLFNTGHQFRPAMAGAMALVLVLGGGTVMGVSHYSHPTEVQASATVNDLQILDKNEQAIQQMDQLLQEDSGEQGSGSEPAS